MASHGIPWPHGLLVLRGLRLPPPHRLVHFLRQRRRRRLPLLLSLRSGGGGMGGTSGGEAAPVAHVMWGGEAPAEAMVALELTRMF